MKITVNWCRAPRFDGQRISKWLLLTIGFLIGLSFNSQATTTATGTISFENEGFTAGAAISDNHIYNAIGLQFKVYVANFDGTPSANGDLYYDPGDGSGPWNKFPTEFGDGGFVTADVTSNIALRWIDPEAMVIKTANGQAFQMKSFKVHDAEWNSWGNYIKVSGYDNGVLLGSQSFVITSNAEPYHSKVSLTNPIFANVDEVRITFDKTNSPGYSSQPQYDGLYHSFDTFVVESAVTNATPTATNVTFTGTLKTGQKLSGSYKYNDADSDPESGSIFKWYRSDNVSGSNKTAISNATSQNYTLTSADAGKYISFSVTPKDGKDAGKETESNLQGPVSVPVPDIQIKGNNIAITKGDNTPASQDHTDFGSVAAVSGSILRIFTIENKGDADLHLKDSEGPGFVNIAGAQAGDFSITVQPGASIQPGSSTSFTVMFDPSGIGSRSAILSIASDDPDAGSFEFTIKGTGLNTSPVITSDGGGLKASVSIKENTTTVTRIIATDQDSDIVTFAISGGADKLLFSINAQTGALGFSNLPDFESPADADNDGVYEVEIAASDGKGGVDKQSIAVSITDVDDVAPVITVNEVISTLQGGEVVINSTVLQADDEDTDNDILIYTVTEGPENGFLELVTNPGKSIDSFSQAEINANQVVYVHNGGDSEQDSFIFDVKDGSGNIITGQVFSISIKIITEVNKPANVKEVRVYPNPAIDILKLDIENVGEQELVIFNSQGTEVLNFIYSDEKLNIDISALPAGIYQIGLRSEKGFHISKFVKK